MQYLQHPFWICLLSNMAAKPDCHGYGHVTANTQYLENAMQEERTLIEEHRYAKLMKYSEHALPVHLEDHAYAIIRDPYLIIDQQYADDTRWASTSEHKINNIK